MTPIFRLWVVGVVLGSMACARIFAAEAGDASIIAAVRAADDERVAASIAVDRARLEAVFSDDLRYAHSNGNVDTKKSYIDSIVEGRSVYKTYNYVERNFTPVAPGVVLMSGRALVDTSSAGQPLRLDLGFLAVWRLENGAWRFVAWQSCRMPAAAPAK